MNVELVRLGASRLHPATGAAVAQCQAPLANDGTDAEDWGETPIFGALGVTALPAASGSAAACAEAVVVYGVAGDGVVVASRDARVTETVGQLSPGETCLHATGDGFESRVFCKEQLVAIVVGNDLVMTFDRAASKIQIAGFGHLFEMSADNGICLTESTGVAMIQLKDGKLFLKGSSVYIGDKAAIPATAVLIGAAPPGAPSASVFASP